MHHTEDGARTHSGRWRHVGSRWHRSRRTRITM